jgi:hypothetical protein
MRFITVETTNIFDSEQFLYHKNPRPIRPVCPGKDSRILTEARFEDYIYYGPVAAPLFAMLGKITSLGYIV